MFCLFLLLRAKSAGDVSSVSSCCWLSGGHVNSAKPDARRPRSFSASSASPLLRYRRFVCATRAHSAAYFCNIKQIEPPANYYGIFFCENLALLPIKRSLRSQGCKRRRTRSRRYSRPQYRGTASCSSRGGSRDRFYHVIFQGCPSEHMFRFRFRSISAHL